MNILSIQSAVSFGHVGNSAAVFPLQRLGAEIWPIDTVQFSNHPGYGDHTGAATSPDLIRSLVDGIEARGALTTCNALLTGYIGDPGTGAALLHAAARLRTANPSAIWCCDPVIGDDGPGIYVRPGVAGFFQAEAVPAVDVLTPNQFELGQLAGAPCCSLADVQRAVSSLQGRMPASGPRAVLVTSLSVEDTPADALDMLAATPSQAYRLRTTLLPMVARGAGDVMAALFLFHLLETGQIAAALENAASSVHGLLSHTLEAGRSELLLVGAQDQFVSPDKHFTCAPC